MKNLIHLLPIADPIAHERTADCICGPKIEFATHEVMAYGRAGSVGAMTVQVFIHEALSGVPREEGAWVGRFEEGGGQ